MGMRRSQFVLVFCALGLVNARAAEAQNVLYVDAAQQGGSPDGSSWQSAYTDLQLALDHAQALGGTTEIRVAGGVYRPDRGLRDRTRSFALRSGVTLRGGFAGSQGPDPDLRDVDQFETVLSGDLKLDDDTTGTSENALHVVEASSASSSAVLDGFTVRAGNANGTGTDRYGGGMRNIGGRPTIIRCRFESNFALNDGGAVFNSGRTATGTFNQCTFEANSAGGRGGAVLNDAAGDATERVTFTACTFLENSAANGGALFNSGGGVAFLDCLFESNQAGQEGGGMVNFTSSAVLVGCDFLDNSAADGGAVYNNSSRPAVERCLFSGNTSTDDGGAMFNQNAGPSLSNCAFVDNAAGDEGGALWNFNTLAFSVRNCTFSGNTAADRGGAFFNWGTTGGGSHPDLANCVLWGNLDSTGSGESAQMQTVRGAPSLNYSCVQGLTGALGGTGNIGSDPELEVNGWRLAAGSPCMDQGDPLYEGADSETDLAGGPRVQNGRVDMGAHELNLDADGDGVADQVDNCVDTPNPDQADTDGDGFGDACDPCPDDASNDADGDGWCAGEDNCPQAANVGQQDADGDGAGDACDPCPNDSADDADGDGWCADEDNCPANANPGQEDSDGDGAGDACDPCPSDPANDADGDGWCGDQDNCPANANPGQEDADDDGAGDVCDADDEDDADPDAPGPTLHDRLLKLTLTTIPGFDLELFEGKNANARRERRDSLARFAAMAAEAVAAGNEHVAGKRLEKLLKHVDGHREPGDWMRPGPERDELAAEVRELLSLLEQPSARRSRSPRR